MLQSKTKKPVLESPVTEAEGYFQQALDEIKQLKFLDAKLKLNRALEKKQDSRYLHQRALVHDKLNNPEAALHDFNVTIKLEEKADYFLDRGNFQFKNGKYASAIWDYNKVIEREPKNSDCYYRLACAYEKIKNQLPKVIENLDKAIKCNPKDARYYDMRARILAKQERYSDALLENDKAIDLDKNMAAYWFNRGITKTRILDFGGALTDISRAVTIEPTNKKYSGGQEELELKIAKLDIKKELRNSLRISSSTKYMKLNGKQWEDGPEIEARKPSPPKNTNRNSLPPKSPELQRWNFVTKMNEETRKEQQKQDADKQKTPGREEFPEMSDKSEFH